MLNLLLVGAGGFIGSVLRYFFSLGIFKILHYPIFPYGTLVVNLIGCLIIGFCAGLAELRNAFTPELRLFVFVGILGGFTTFSSFGYETFGLLREEEFFMALANVFIQVFVGLGAVWLGFVCARFF